MSQDIEDSEVVDKATESSVEDMPDYRDHANDSNGDLQSSLADWTVKFLLLCLRISAYLKNSIYFCQRMGKRCCKQRRATTLKLQLAGCSIILEF